MARRAAGLLSVVAGTRRLATQVVRRVSAPARRGGRAWPVLLPAGAALWALQTQAQLHLQRPTVVHLEGAQGAEEGQEPSLEELVNRIRK